MLKLGLNRLITFLNAINIYLVLPLLVLIVLSDIMLRFFINSPIVWAHEVSGLLLICLFFLAIPYCIQSKQLLHVDIAYNVMGRKQRLCANFLSQLLILGFSVLLVCQGYLGVIDSLSYDGRAYTVNIPYWPFYGLITFVGLICAGQSLLELLTQSTSDSLENDSVVSKMGSDHL